MFDYYRNETSIALVHWAKEQLVVTDPDEVDFNDIGKSSPSKIDDGRSRGSIGTLNSKYSKPILRSVANSRGTLDGNRSAAAKEVDYFGDKKLGREHLSVADLISIRNGGLVLKPGQKLPDKPPTN